MLLQRARTENKTNTTPTSDRRCDKRWPSDIVTFRHAGYLLAGAITKIKKKKKSSQLFISNSIHYDHGRHQPIDTQLDFLLLFFPCLFYRDLLPAIVFFCTTPPVTGNDRRSNDPSLNESAIRL